MVRIENLKFSYDKRTLVFNDLNLSLSGSKIYGLLGRNGTGKTSLLKLMMGLRFPKSGTCEVFGMKSEERFPSMLREMMFVPEEIYTPSLLISQYVNLYAPFYPHFDHKRFNLLLEEFELQHSDDLKKLSLGQKKKAVLSFAMAANTKILLLDEPTNGLDIPSKSQFRRMIANLATDDKCIVISTHQAQDIEKLIDSVIILDDGNILLKSSIEEISENLSVEISSKSLPNALYSEERLGGVFNIVKNDFNEQSEFNLELFFNAVMANKSEIKELFKTERS